MKQKIISIALALALCAGLTEFTLAADEENVTIAIPEIAGDISVLQFAITKAPSQYYYAQEDKWRGYSFILTEGSEISTNLDLGLQDTSNLSKRPGNDYWDIGYQPESNDIKANEPLVFGGDEPHTYYILLEGVENTTIHICFDYYTDEYLADRKEPIVKEGTLNRPDDSTSYTERPLSELTVNPAQTAPLPTLTAAPTSSTVLVNGETQAFDAYNISDNNYFKLRDLAHVLNGTEKQFEVGYDEATRAITLTSGAVYTPVGGEMSGKGEGVKTPTPTTSKIYLDGAEVSFTAYMIDGNNYFKLRDIGQAFDFEVDWDGERQTIVIDTSKEYTPD
jgi:hypothetical protein